jgi:3-hydroxyisobutyrate dehydrogenase
MGAAIASRLLSLERKIVVWNRSREKTEPLAAAGAQVAATAAELASRCECVMSILADGPAVESTYGAGEGLLAGEVAGKLFIEMSTVRPRIEERLAERARALGAAFVDSPVGGSVGPAREGRLFAFVGAEAVDFERAKGVLELVCRRVEHVGPVGSGARMKLAINLPLLVYWQALAEALVLCRPLGLEPARLIDIFADTSGGPNVLKARGGAIQAALAGAASGAVTFDVDSVRKDLRTMIEEGETLGRDLPLARRVLECYDEAVPEGLGGADVVRLLTRFLDRQG